MDCTSHLIELKRNLGGSFVLNRQLFQLHGSIKNPCSCQLIQIRRENDGISWSVEMSLRTFKHLIRLIKDSVNFIEVKYCNARIALSIEHKSIQSMFYDVQPIYIINKNHHGRFQSTSDDQNNNVEDALEKIDLALELVQCIISSKLNENMFGERSFVLQNCEAFYSDLETTLARNMTQYEIYDAIAEELLVKEGIDVKNRRKFVGFLSCTRFDGLSENEKYSYENIKAKTSANPALGGGFLCLMGSGCFYSWPKDVDDVIESFMSKNTVDLSQTLDDSNYRKTYGGCFSTSLGSLVHEMGHIFDLAHTDSGLMGNDIDLVHRFFLSENFTEILPKRIVRSCEVNQKTAKSSNPQKFTKLKKPGGLFLEKYYEQKNNDMTFFEPNCLVTLWCHRWFHQSPCNDENNLSFCAIERKVKSKTSQITLVEVRELNSNDSMLINYFSLMEKNVTEFVIPSQVKLKNVTLFAISRQGDLLKTDLM